MTGLVTAHNRESTPQADQTEDLPKWIALGLFILAGGAASVSLLGPLFFDVIRYHVSEGATNQIVGGDVAGLVLMAPVGFFAGVLVLRGHRAGPVLALGPAVYAMYMYSQLALGSDTGRYPGNSEQFFMLFLGLFILAAAIFIGSWMRIGVSELPSAPKRRSLVIGWFSLVIAAFLLAGLHLPGLINVWMGQPGSEYAADPVVFWLVKIMDLGLVVPALVTVGIGVLRDKDWATKPKFAVVGWIALLGSSVAGMAMVMLLTFEPAASVGNVVAFGVFAVVGLVVAVTAYRPLFTPRRS